MTHNSGLFIGSIRHRRYTPIKHSFLYSIFMPAIDLDEIDALATSVKGFSLNKWALASLHHKDYFDGRVNIKQAAQEKLQELTGESLTGKVIAICQLRYLGIYFSPVNFYYLFDDKGSWRYLLAEVSNTPWHEKHYYAVPNKKNWQHQKAFHVSPFNPIEQEYSWKVSRITDKVFIHLAVKKSQLDFDATLAMKKQPFTTAILMKQLIKTPIMAVKIISLIYWQAFRLWLKGAPFYSHPKHSKE